MLPPPNRLLPEGFEVPKSTEVDDELVEGVPPKLKFGDGSDMTTIAQERVLGSSNTYSQSIQCLRYIVVDGEGDLKRA